MAWLQFAFPECPRCAESWKSSVHKDCGRGGTLELDPDAKQVRCDGCARQWNVWDSQFYCSCGHLFTAWEVDSALNEVIRAAHLLAQIIEQHRADLMAIQRAGQDSLRGWFARVAENVGGTLGKVLGTIVGSVTKMLFGRS
jgi:hypothetical protein